MPDSTENRRREIARLDYESAFGMTGAQHAATYAVSQSQISQDRKSDAYADELSKCDGGRLRRIDTKSWTFIEAAIDIALPYMTDDTEADKNILNAPKGVLYRALDCIKISLEHTAKLDKPADGDNPASALLAGIFAPGITQLQADNAALQAELDEIKRRVSALNGQGVEILRDLPGQEERYMAPDESTWISKQAYEEHTGRKAEIDTPIKHIVHGAENGVS